MTIKLFSHFISHENFLIKRFLSTLYWNVMTYSVVTNIQQISKNMNYSTKFPLLPKCNMFSGTQILSILSFLNSYEKFPSAVTFQWYFHVCVCSFVPRTPIVFLFLFSYSGFTYTFMVIVGYLRINLLENHLRNSMKGIANTLVFVWQYAILYKIRSEKDLVWCNIVLLWCAFLSESRKRNILRNVWIWNFIRNEISFFYYQKVSLVVCFCSRPVIEICFVNCV